MMAATWRVDATRILTRSEIAAVLADLRRRGRRSVNSRQNLVIFRLAACCGLRVSEATGLRLSDVRAGIDRPYVNIRKSTAKRGKGRRVPLWWDAATLADLSAWKAERQAQGAKAGGPFLCCQAANAFGRPLGRLNARKRFIASARALGPERCERLTIHDGRHSFASHSLAGGRTLAEVQAAMGHANISTTSVYLHVAVEDNGEVGNLFAFNAA